MNNSNERPLGWTTLEESKQLVKAGISIESADMYWAPDTGTVVPTPYMTNNVAIRPIPCWSLGALLELIPKIYESEHDGGCYPTLCKRYDTDKWHCLYYRDTLCKTRQYDTAIEAIIEMVIWLLKNGIITKKNKDNSNYFYCKYGGVLPLCAKCKRNPKDSSRIKTFLVPRVHPKQCEDFLNITKNDTN